MHIKLRAAHKLGSLNPEGKLTQGRAIVANIKASPYFDLTRLPIPLDSATLSLKDLEDAIAAAANEAPGTVSHRHETERVVLSVFNVIKSYVEMAANSTTDPKSAIESTGLSVVLTGGSSPVTELTITALGNGVMEVSVPRAKGEVSFIYQFSSDGGLSWLEFDQSKLASRQLKGQTAGNTLSFRYAAVGISKGNFSQPKSAMVL